MTIIRIIESIKKEGKENHQVFQKMDKMGVEPI